MVAFSLSADDEDRSSKAPKEKKKGGRRLSMLLGRMNKKLDNLAESGSRISSIGEGQSLTSWTKKGGRGSKRFSIWGPSTRGDRDSSASGTSSVDPNPASRKGLGLGFSTRFSARHLPVAPNPPKEAKSAKKEAKKEVKKAAPPKEEEKDERSRAERIKEKSEKQEVERKQKEEEQRKMREQAAASEESVFERRARTDVKALKGYFDEHDSDCDGNLDLDGFRQVLKKLALEQVSGKRKHIVFEWDQAESKFHSLDVDGNGLLDFGELLSILFPTASEHEVHNMLSMVGLVESHDEIAMKNQAMSEQERRAQREEIGKLFDIYDTKGRGKLKRGEFHSCMEKTGLTYEDMDKVFDEYAQPPEDTSHGHVYITKEQFIDMMEHSGAFGGEALFQHRNQAT